MNDSINAVQSLLTNLTPPLSITADMEILCQGFEKIFDGQLAEMSVFSQRLNRILEWAKVRPLAKGSSTAKGWRAQYAGIPKLGGTLTCQNDVWELILSFNANSTAYLGSWRSLRPGEDDHGGLFSIENADSGQVLVLDNGHSKQQVLLADSERIAWGCIAAFLQKMQNEDSLQLDAPVSTPTPASFPSAKPDEELSPDATPTILASPERRLSEKIGKKRVLVEQAATVHPNTWDCTCGRKNTGAFCPKCGSKKPAQPTVCRHCGGVLSIGARFCRNCGAEVRD